MKPIAHFLSTLAIIGLLSTNAVAQTKETQEPINILRLDTTVSSPIAPDTAVMVLAAEKSGADPSVTAQIINKLMGDAMAQSKATSGVEAMTGNFSTYQQYDNKGAIIGWTVRSEIILKSKDFALLSKLSGNLSQTLKIMSSGFEVSRELRSREDVALQTQGLQAFQAKARLAAQTLGFSGYTIREITLQQAQLEHGNQPRPMMMARAAMADAAPVQIEAGRTAMQLTVSGTVQLK